MSPSTTPNLHESIHGGARLRVDYSNEDFYVAWLPAASGEDIAAAFDEAATLGLTPDLDEHSAWGDGSVIPLYFTGLDELHISERQAHYDLRMTKGLDWQSSTL